MYARIINITAQSETQLTMWQEMFKNIGSKNLTELGAIQITLTKISPLLISGQLKNSSLKLSNVGSPTGLFAKIIFSICIFISY